MTNKRNKDYLTPLLFKHLRRIIPPRVKEMAANFRYRIFDMFSDIYIETTTACNRRCPYCPNSKFDRGLLENAKKMDIKLFHKIIDELSEIGWVGQVQPHFYGEPLLDDRLPDLVEYVRSKLPGSSIAIYTNGDLLTLEVYKKLIGSGVTDFIVTQHQDEPLDCIKTIQQYREKSGNDNVYLSYQKLQKISSRGGIIPILANNSCKVKKCYYPSSNIGINYAGDVIFCCEDYFNTIKLGNCNNENIIKIWDKPYYKNLRIDARKAKKTFEICTKCRWGIL